MLNNFGEMLDFFNQSEAFISSVQYTAEKFIFTDELVEKDYLCSLVLSYFYNNDDFPLIFKGGTLLTKSYTGFNRLSEDLDFTLPVSISLSRKQRSQKIKPIKHFLQSIPYKLPIFRIKIPLTGYNNSTLYSMTLSYKSKTIGTMGDILIDISLKDSLLQPGVEIDAHTLLNDPFTYELKIKPFKLKGLSLQEAFAEKIRAAFYRKNIAIRDFYDLDYAEVNKIIEFNDKDLLDLVKEKVANESHFHNLKDESILFFLKSKIESELYPTLKQSSNVNFNLDRIINTLLDLHGKLL